MRQAKVEEALPLVLNRIHFKSLSSIEKQLNDALEKRWRGDSITRDQVELALARAVEEGWVEARAGADERSYRLTGEGQRPAHMRKEIGRHPRLGQSKRQVSLLRAR